MDLEPHDPHALPERVCRTEKPRRFVLISGGYGEIGKAFKDVGKR